MNVKLKIGFLVVIIVLIFIVLYILKTNKETNNSNINFNQSIIPVIEKFTDSCLDLKNKDIFCITENDTEEINNFRNSMTGRTLVLIEDDMFSQDSNKKYILRTQLNLRNKEKIIHNKNKKFFIFGPSGVAYDNKNDDLVVFDLGIFRRFHCREDRTLDPDYNQPQFKFYIEGMKEIKNEDEINKYNLIKYLDGAKRIQFKTGSLSDIDLESKDFIQQFKSIDKNYQKVIQELELANTTTFNILVVLEDYQEYKRKNERQGLTFIESEEEFNDKYGIKYIGEKGYNKYKFDIKVLYNNFVIYKKKIGCIVTDNIQDINKCQVKYQQDLPKYQMGDLKGITELGFDDDPRTIYHTYMLDTSTNKNMSPWEDSEYSGNFRPQISYYSNRSKDFDFDNFKEARDSGIKGIEKFSNMTYKLQDEYENIGVGMFLDSEYRELFVPDVENNRIQIFDIEDNKFVFTGQFGNINTISYRSLPMYQGDGLDSNDKVQDTNPLIGGYLLYEPLINNDTAMDIEGYGKYTDYYDKSCIKDVDSNTRKNYVKKGPLGIEKEYYHCNVEFSSRRANIHEYNIKDKENSKRGHFYHLLNEYNRIKDKKLKYLNDNESNPQFINPHHLGIKIQIYGTIKEDNAITSATLAYRKVILKTIKETDEGQKFGQLFRPKSIAYDDEINKDGNKYYVVDTFHHCVQCFERLPDKLTVQGNLRHFESPDRYYNDDLNKYLYDENWESKDGVGEELYKKYNRSRIYSLGARQKLLLAVDKNKNNINKNTQDIYEFFDREDETTGMNIEWAKKNGQTYNNIYVEDKDKRVQEIVKLTRWVSGKGYIDNVDRTKTYDPVFYSELSQDNEHKKYPGVGMFSYPSDIVICKNPFKEEKLMMISDMGNDRVCIFKKYLVSKEGGVNHFRFRFFDFLNKEDIINPLSITVSDFTGKVYVLDGQFKKQKIYIYKPNYDLNNNSYINYSKSEDIIDIKDMLKEEHSGKEFRISKIRIDNRGMIAMTDMNNQSLYVVGEKIDLQNQNIKSPIIKTSANKISFNFELSLLNRNFNLPNMNRFRIFLQRQNISKSNNFYEYNISPEFLYSHSPKDIDERKKYNFIVEDSYSSKDFKNCWVSYKNNDYDVIKIDDYDYVLNKVTVSEEVNTDIDKKYINKKIINIYNKVLEGYEDYFGESIKPNSSYKYNYGFYNYVNGAKLNTESLELHTMPLGISPEDITKENVVNDTENYIKLKIDYGKITDLHRETQYFNPICFYIIRAKHNRTKDVNMKYLNLDKGNMIQLLVPNESKYIFSKFSKPKYGKLYVYNVYNPLSIREQNRLMKEGELYDKTKMMLFYSAEGGIRKEGGFPIPRSKDVPTDFIDDFFTLGDDPKNIHKKIKFRVRIGLNSQSDKIIQFDDNNKIDTILGHYSKVKGISDDYSFKKIYKLSGVTKSGLNYSYGPITFCDKGTTKSPIEPNQTYEYCIFTANPYRINPAINTFYYTTKPEKIYIKEVKKVKEMVEGREKNFLKLLWYTPKDNAIYWPYNFLLLRKRVFNESEKMIMNSGITMDKDYNFSFKNKINVEFKNSKYNNLYDIQDKEIMIKPEVNQIDDTNQLEFVIDLKEEKEWKITFGRFDHMNIEPISYNFKYTIISKNLKKEEKEFLWKSTNRFITFKGSQIHMKLNLRKRHTFKIDKIDETIIPKDQNSEIDTAYNEIEANENKIESTIKGMIEMNIQNQKNEEIIKELEKQRQIKEIGFHFTLEDDYQGYFDNIDNNKGYSGDLYRYLKPLEEKDLLKIFDELHDKVKVLTPQVDMRMDGPSGMLRSGGREMLIDKIRHLSFLLRQENQMANRALGVKCQDTSLKNLMSNSLGTCISEKYQKKMDEQQKILEEQMTERKNNIEVSKRKRRDIASKRLETERKAQSADNQEFENLKKELEELKKLEQSENDKLAKFNEEQQEYAERKLMEQNAESIINIERNIIPDSIDLELKQFSQKPFYIKGILKNHKYIGEPGSFSRFGSGAKIRLGKLQTTDIVEGFYAIPDQDELGEMKNQAGGKQDNKPKKQDNIKPIQNLLTFLKDLRSVISLDKYRTEYEQMHGFGFDLEKQEFYFFKKGVDILEDKQNIVVAQNNIILLKSNNKDMITGDSIEDMGDMNLPIMSSEDIEKMKKDKLKKLNKQLEVMKKSVKDEEDANIVRQNRMIEAQNGVKKSELSEWSFIKYGENSDLFFEEPIGVKTKKDILRDYGIKPTLVSLSGSIINGDQLFKPSELEKIQNIKERNKIKKQMYIGHKQMIDIGATPDDFKYEYRIAIYPTGFSFDEDDKRRFMGLDYITNLGRNPSNLPYLDLGEVYSDAIFEGSQVSNRKVVNKPFEPTEISSPPAPEIPVIKYFEPKFGYENTVVKIVGLGLDEIDYFCFRDIKVDVIRKTEIKVDGELYQMYLVKPPTLKELNRECWQSLERYKVLVWGYYKNLGIQIRSSENKDNLNAEKSIMFTYNDRKKCSEDLALQIPK